MRFKLHLSIFFYLEQELHMIESEVSWDALYILKKNKLWELL